MKRIISLSIILILLVCGCTKEPPPPPEPVYNTAPAISEGGITICGEDIGGVYMQGDLKYIKVKELAAALGGSFDVYEDITDHQAKMTFDGTDYTFTTLADGIETYKNCLYDGTDWYAPAEPILSAFDFKVFVDEEQKRTYYTDYPLATEIPEGYKVPTLMYHAVSDKTWGIASLFVSPSKMEEQIKYLVDNGYTPIFFEDLVNVDKIQKPVLLTFDDGYDNNYTELLPILEKYNVKATVFVITDLIGTKDYMTAEQVKEMADSGLVSIQSHTVTHPNLNELGKEKLDAELKNSKLEIARITGKEPFVLCYPSGKYSQTSLDKTREYYQFGLLMSGPIYETGDNPVKITRKYISRSTSLSSFKSMLGE